MEYSEIPVSLDRGSLTIYSLLPTPYSLLPKTQTPFTSLIWGVKYLNLTYLKKSVLYVNVPSPGAKNGKIVGMR
jgi:hypothetical protein